MPTRRDILKVGAAFAGGALMPWRVHGALPKAAEILPGDGSPGLPEFVTPVVMPNGTKLPYTMDGKVKVFHLVAKKVKREFAPGMVVDCWGYNGQCHGPMIEAVIM